MEPWHSSPVPGLTSNQNETFFHVISESDQKELATETILVARKTEVLPHTPMCVPDNFMAAGVSQLRPGKFELGHTASHQIEA